MTARIIEFPPLRGFLVDLAEMDGLEAYEAEGRTFVTALHRHRPDADERIEIRRPSDIDLLLEDARRCLWADCAGRMRVALRDSRILEEYSCVRKLMGASL